MVRRVRKGGGEGFIDLPKLVPPTALQKRIAEGILDTEIVEALHRFGALKTAEKLDLITAAKLSGKANLIAPLADIRSLLVGFQGKWDPVLAHRYISACSSLLMSAGWKRPDATVPVDDWRALAAAYLDVLGDLVEKSPGQLDEAQWFGIFEAHRNALQAICGLLPLDRRAPGEERIRIMTRGAIEKSLEGSLVLARGRLWPIRFFGMVASGEDSPIFARVAEARTTLVGEWRLDHGHDQWSRELLMSCAEPVARLGDSRVKVGLANEIVAEIRAQEDASVRRRLLTAVESLMTPDNQAEIASLVGSLALSDSEHAMASRMKARAGAGDGR